MYVELVTVVVDDYDRAIRFFVDVLGFALAEDSAATTGGGAPKRWGVVRPPGGGTGHLLARADGERQARAIGEQAGGRVGFFLRVFDFDAALAALAAAGIALEGPPRREPYGRVAVFRD